MPRNRSREILWNAVGIKNTYNLACSKRSDSGERCEVKKAMKSRGEPLSERLEQATYNHI